MRRQFEPGKPRWLQSDMSWDRRLYFLRDSWHGFWFCRRRFVCRRLVVPLTRRIFGSQWPMTTVLTHLDDLEDSLMYSYLCYDLPSHIPVEDRIAVGRRVIDETRSFIKYNYFKHPEEDQ